ncbi:hypothetical protein [Raineyella fluvialis]|uniref:Uncharacterized protein n=1 Tax=Raineyella fluvialis TaxID=2662261 RepID=A0A5Q2F8T3_9ACTN|nr:hypothetical protein [Raineyella fluvialis]QGF23249.1 hypothetical protein Rai3103_05755 [Raineyella fluvialis]
MSRRRAGKGTGRRKPGSGHHGTPEARSGERDAVDEAIATEQTTERSSAVLAGHPILSTMPHCGACGGSIRWMLPKELKDVDREAYRKVTAGIAPDVVERSDVWWCPSCGAVGIEDYWDDPFMDEEDLDAVDLDDRCTACGTEVEWYDPAHVATIDKGMYMQAKRLFGAADLLGGEAAICPECGRITFFPQEAAT